jgi:hypothetical protein
MAAAALQQLAQELQRALVPRLREKHIGGQRGRRHRPPAFYRIAEAS